MKNNNLQKSTIFSFGNPIMSSNSATQQWVVQCWSSPWKPQYNLSFCIYRQLHRSKIFSIVLLSFFPPYITITLQNDDTPHHQLLKIPTKFEVSECSEAYSLKYLELGASVTYILCYHLSLLHIFPHLLNKGHYIKHFELPFLCLTFKGVCSCHTLFTSIISFFMTKY